MTEVLDHHLDQLRIFRGDDQRLTDTLSVRQPRLGEICNYGEQAYFSLVKTLTATPADRKVEIWDALHVYWDQVDEFELFKFIFPVLERTDCSILIPNVDFHSFQISVHPQTKDVVLRNADGVLIDRTIHLLLTDYLRKIHRMKKNVDVGFDDYTKEIMIEDDRDEQARMAKKPFPSILQPMISALTNSPEFKYRFDDVWDLPIGAFLDAAERIQKLKGYDHVMHGIYSGCVDIKKLNKKELNWMGELK